MICSANQWSGFYMILASVVKGLRDVSYLREFFLAKVVV